MLMKRGLKNKLEAMTSMLTVAVFKFMSAFT